MMQAQDKGLDIEPAQQEAIGDPFVDKEGNVKQVFTNPGGDKPFEVLDVEELEGMERMPTRETEVRLSPYEKTKQRGKAEQELDITNPNWALEKADEFIKSSFDIRRDMQAEKGSKYRIEAEKKIAEHIKREIANVKDENVEIRDGERGFGYYGEKSGYIRDLPPQVSPSSLLEQREDKSGEPTDPLGIR
jgi:hypothetical protein